MSDARAVAAASESPRRLIRAASGLNFLPRRGRNIVLGVLGAAAFIGAWELITQGLRLVRPLILPSPVSVVHEARWLAAHHYAGTTLGQNTVASLETVFVGWGLAILIGVPLGVLMGWSDGLRRSLNPIVEVLRPIPPPAWIPFAVLWFGIASTGRIFVVVIAAVMPCIVSAYGAVLGRDRTIVEAAACLGASRTKTLRSIVIPTAADGILAGIRIALGNAWMTVVAAELVASSAGLGYVLVQAQYALDPSVVLVSMAIIGAVGGVLSLGFAWFERRLLYWKHGG